MSLETLSPDAVSRPWSWLKTISRELFALDETPLTGNPPPFPWEKLSQEFAKTFSLEGFQITPGELKLRENDEIMAGLTTPCLATQVAATGMEGTCAFWMSREDVKLFMSKILHLSNAVSEMQPADLVATFHRFLSVESVHMLNMCDFDKRISFKISSHSEEKPPAALCQDINIAIGKDNIFARLVIPNEFRKSWRNFFLKAAGPAQAQARAKLDDVETTIHLEAGRTTLTVNELLNIHPGDLLLLDHVFYNSDPEKSRILLTLNGKPLFRARLKAGSLKILEIPLHNEVYDSMIEKVNPAQTPSNIGPTEPNQPPHLEEDNPFPDEEEDEEDLELADANAMPPAGAPTARTPPPAAKSPSVAPTPAQMTGPLTSDNIPIQLVVEVGAVNMSVQKLLELAPGNLLDLDLAPENGVNLVVNGRIVGKGELLEIGESIGVRILQIGV